MAKALARSHAALKALEQRYGLQALANAEGPRPTRRGGKSAQADLADLGQRIHAHQAERQALKTQLTALPKRVPVKEVVAEAEIVRLAPETKHLTDTLRMLACRAGTALAQALGTHYARTEDQGRALIRAMLLSDADVVPHQEQQRLVV